MVSSRLNAAAQRADRHDYYMDCLATYTLAPTTHVQSQEISDRVCASAISAISSHFQSVPGSGVAVANKLISGYTPTAPAETDFNILTAAQVFPDPHFSAAEANRRHAAAGVAYRLLPGEAAGLICARIISGIDHIRMTALAVAPQGSKPPELLSTSTHVTDPALPVGPWSINRPVAFLLHNYLTAQPNVAALTRSQIQADRQALLGLTGREYSPSGPAPAQA